MLARLPMTALRVAARHVAAVPALPHVSSAEDGYGLGRWSALGRTIVLVSFAMSAASLFIALLFAAGLF